MPVASGDPSQLELLKALLAQKGLLATGGNIRSLPFSDEASGFPASSDGSASTDGSIPSANGAGAATRPPGPTPLVKNGQLIDPASNAPITGQIADDWWKYLLAGAGIAGGVSLADALRRRKGGAPSEGGVPTVEGEVITDPLAALPDNQTPINGEYTDVPEAALAGQPKQITGPTTVEVLADRNKQLPVRPRPRANPIPDSAGISGVVTGRDAMGDIPPEEIENAKALVAQLIANRAKGNAAKASQSRFSRRAVQPTGPTDKGAEEGLLNTIIRLMRESGATRVLPRAM